MRLQPHIKQHLYYYVSMAALQLVGFFVVLTASPHIQTQMILVIITSGIYVFWALLHQFLHHDLHPKVVLEYVLVGFLGISISFFLFRLQM
jgi:hypothetical protein